jgi:hypothetical protein
MKKPGMMWWAVESLLSSNFTYCIEESYKNNTQYPALLSTDGGGRDTTPWFCLPCSSMSFLSDY